MSQNPNEPLEPWEMREFIKTTTNFRADLEREQLAFREAVAAIPDIRRETRRQSAALFEEDPEKSGTGMPGLVRQARNLQEFLVGLRWARWLVVGVFAMLLSLLPLLGFLARVLYSLNDSGALGKLIK